MEEITVECKELLRSYRREISLLTNEKKQLKYQIKFMGAILDRYTSCKWWEFRKRAKYLERLKREIQCD